MPIATGVFCIRIYLDRQLIKNEAKQIYDDFRSVFY